MSRNLSAGMLANLSEESLTLVECIRVDRRDGVSYGFTTHDDDLTYNGLIYEAMSAANASAVRQKVGTGVDNLDITGLLTSDRITPEDLLAGRYDGAGITVQLLNWKSLADGAVPLLRGIVGNIRVMEGQYVAEVRSLTQRLSQTIGEVTSPTCRVRRFGDSQCNPPGGLATYQFHRTIAALDVDVAGISGVPVFQMNAGGLEESPYVAELGNVEITKLSQFGSDTSLATGTPIDTIFVTNPAPEEVYNSFRFGEWSYTLTGQTVGKPYRLRLHFAELYWGTEGTHGTGGAESRVFDVHVQGIRLLTDIDIYQRAGGANIAHVEELDVIVNSSGNIVIEFQSRVDHAMCCGIELIEPDVASMTKGVAFGGESHEDSYYNYGEAEFTSGANIGVVIEIKQHRLSAGQAVLRFSEALPFPLQVGDQATLTAGCDRTFPSCRYKFNNVVNFRGEPHVPGFDALMKRGRGRGNE